MLNAEGTADEDAPRFVDVWRAQHPALRHYTYFSYRFNCREKGIGWRLDMCACFLSFTLSFCFVLSQPGPLVSPRTRAERSYGEYHGLGSVERTWTWLTLLFRAQSW